MSSEEKCRKAGLVDQLSGCGCALVQRQFELQNIEKLCKQLFEEHCAAVLWPDEQQQLP